jgi:hypothetical protein
MPKQRYTTEEIIHRLREMDVLLGQGKTIAEATKQIGVTDKTKIDECFIQCVRPTAHPHFSVYVEVHPSSHHAVMTLCTANDFSC